jgi:hypothetical protein
MYGVRSVFRICCSFITMSQIDVSLETGDIEVWCETKLLEAKDEIE